MEYFLQQLINGLTLGSVYGLIAIGYTMVYGIIGMINFAHGDIFMVGAFVALISFKSTVSDEYMSIVSITSFCCLSNSAILSFSFSPPLQIPVFLSKEQFAIRKKTEIKIKYLIVLIIYN